MIQTDSIRDARDSLPVVMAIGVFDGVHLGHQAIIRAARDEAARIGGRAWVLTFSPHPVRVLRPGHAPRQICTEAQSRHHLSALHPHGCIVLPFTHALAILSPRAFWEMLREGLPSLAAISVGDNWRFGCEAAGDIHTLREFADADGVRVIVPASVEYDRHPVSSTRIRRAIHQGHLELAAAMLGRPFALEGEIVHGRKQGRVLGFPTVNVLARNECLPAAGVYAARVWIGGEGLPGAGYQAPEPPGPEAGDEGHTAAPRVFEVHLLDCDRDLYGEWVQVDLLHRTRAPLPPGEIPDLRARIAEDVAAVRAYFHPGYDDERNPYTRG